MTRAGTASQDVSIPASSTEDVERKQHPPPAPELDARIRIPVIERFGLAFIALMPVLGIVGLLDGHDTRIERSAGDLTMSAEVPSRLRENLPGHISIEVQNHGTEPNDVEVALSPEYLAHFTSIEMAPPPHRAWATMVHVEPGEDARVNVEIIAEEPGRHTAVLRASALGGPEIREDVSTFVFP